MHVIHARNAHDALPKAVLYLRLYGDPRSSRDGAVLLAPEPVTTVYERSDERVLFWPERDANPFLHLFGALWMLAGRNDAEFLQQFAPRIGDYAEDDGIFHGAYGTRWWSHFDVSQLGWVADALRKNPDCRRQVIAMWDANVDLGTKARDIPCNTHVYPTRGADGSLDITVCCRSNDVVWGCYGADVVDFGFLHEYLAASIGCAIGTYRQVSNNWHGYDTTFKKIAYLGDERWYPNPYRGQAHVTPFPLIAHGEEVRDFDRELRTFLNLPDSTTNWVSPFLNCVAAPMLSAHRAYKNTTTSRNTRIDNAIIIIHRYCAASDWSRAAVEWLERRRR